MQMQNAVALVTLLAYVVGIGMGILFNRWHRQHEKPTWKRLFEQLDEQPIDSFDLEEVEQVLYHLSGRAAKALRRLRQTYENKNLKDCVTTLADKWLLIENEPFMSEENPWRYMALDVLRLKIASADRRLALTAFVNTASRLNSELRGVFVEKLAEKDLSKEILMDLHVEHFEIGGNNAREQKAVAKLLAAFAGKFSVSELVMIYESISEAESHLSVPKREIAEGLSQRSWLASLSDQKRRKAAVIVAYHFDYTSDAAHNALNDAVDAAENEIDWPWNLAVCVNSVVEAVVGDPDHEIPAGNGIYGSIEFFLRCMLDVLEDEELTPAAARHLHDVFDKHGGKVPYEFNRKIVEISTDSGHLASDGLA